MTGTPLQNRLTDFASLLQFLRVFPYSNHKVFESHIIDFWKAQGDEAAIERLKKLVRYLTLRRSQATIELPERTDTIQYLDFSPVELVKYRQAESPITEMLDNALSAEDHQSGMYMHVLAKINTLRKFCNLGLYAPTLKTDIGSKLRNPGALAWNNATAQEAFENLASLGQASCVVCCIDLDTTFQDGLSLIDEFPRAQLTQCLRLICDTCFQQTIEDPSAPMCICEDRESCSVLTISTNHVTSSPATPTIECAMDHDEPPTKIKALSIEVQSARFEKM
jgi:SWI/SNF-related matrix-associated actin-dependent regulator of chromatin subfamily A3